MNVVLVTLAVYASVVTVLLIIAACFLLVLVREQKEIVKRAIGNRAFRVGGGRLTILDEVTDEQIRKMHDAIKRQEDRLR